MPFLFYSLIGISSSTLTFFGNPFPSSNAFSIAFLLFIYVYSDTPTAKARWVLNYVDFQIYSKAYKTNLFH